MNYLVLRRWEVTGGQGALFVFLLRSSKGLIARENIETSVVETRKDEQKAQACDNACYQELSHQRMVVL